MGTIITYAGLIIVVVIALLFALIWYSMKAHNEKEAKKRRDEILDTSLDDLANQYADEADRKKNGPQNVNPYSTRREQGSDN